MSTVAVKARRSTISEALDKRGSTVFDVDKGELFDLVAKTSEEALTRTDFDKLHAVISEQAKKEIEEKIAAQSEAAQAKRRSKLLCLISATLFLFLGLSLVGNFIITYQVVDAQVKTAPGRMGTLADKDGNVLGTRAATGYFDSIGDLPRAYMAGEWNEKMEKVDIAVPHDAEGNTFTAFHLDTDGYVIYNSTHGEVFLSAGGSVLINNGQVHVEAHSPQMKAMMDRVHSGVHSPQGRRLCTIYAGPNWCGLGAATFGYHGFAGLTGSTHTMGGKLISIWSRMNRFRS